MHPLKNGYDLPLYGLNDGSFYVLHISAISCLTLSIVCAVVTIIFSFKSRGYRTFFTNWNKRDRLVVYLAICDGVAHVCHVADHCHVFITKDHVRPKGVCIGYAFIFHVTFLVENLLVNFVAVSAFVLVFLKRSLRFGKKDWKVLVWITFLPLVFGVATLASGKYGPTGAYCVFDGVTGSDFMFAFSAVPIMIILPTNATLYLLIWIKLYVQMKAIKQSVGDVSAGMMASRRAVKSMALFVVAYIIQWWPVLLVSLWALTKDNTPYAVIQCVVVFCNLGGTYNMVVFLLLRRAATSVRPLPSRTVPNVTSVTAM